MKPRILFALLLCLLGANAAQAQISRAGDTFLAFTGAARGSAVGFDSANNVYFVVSAHGGLNGRFVSPDGVPLGDMVSLAPAGYAQFPHVAYSPDAKAFLVTYYADGVRAKMVSYTGGIVSSDIALSGSAIYEIMGAPVAYSTRSKEFLVVWCVGYANIQGVRISASGSPSSVFTLNDSTGKFRNNPSVGYNPASDEFLVAYAAGYPGPSAVVQRVKAGSGAVLTGEIPLGQSNDIYLTNVSYNSVTGEYLVSWYQSPPAAIYGRVVAADGTPLGNVLALSTRYGTYDSLFVSHNPISGTALVVGQDRHSMDNGGVEIGGAGAPLGAPVPLIAVPAKSGNYHPRVIAAQNRREWLVVAVNDFSRTVAQRVQTGSTSTTGCGSACGGGTPPPSPSPSPAPAPTPPPAPPPTSPTRGVAGDFGGDGRADPVVFRVSTGEWKGAGGTFATWGRGGDVPVPADYNGDGKVEVAIYRPTTGQWMIQGTPTIDWGVPGDLPAPADYDGDGKTDIAVFRPATGLWYLRNSIPSPVRWGAPADIPVPGDYNGDGKAEIAVFRRSNGTWWVIGNRAVDWGRAGDIPVPADYNGDGKTDMGVYRPATRSWYVREQFIQPLGAFGTVPVALDLDGDRSAELVAIKPGTGEWAVYNRVQNARGSLHVGGQGDMPPSPVLYAVLAVAGDADGDRLADPTVVRPSTATWYSRYSSGSYLAVSFGTPSDVPVAADYDGDGRLDVAFYRPSTGVWYLTHSSEGFARYYPSEQWGTSGDVPIAGDFDGDGRGDLTVYRPSTGDWYVRNSSTGFTTSDSFTWGVSGDIPVPADYDGDGKKDPAVYRPSNGYWYVLLRYNGVTVWTMAHQWGRSNDQPVAADFDGDGLADFAVFRPAESRWYIRESATGLQTFRLFDWGLPGDVAVGADFNGDGFADPAVYRPSTGRWWIRGMTPVDWGSFGDIATLKQ